MPANLPMGFIPKPKQDAIWAQLYIRTEKWKEGSKIVIPDTVKEETFFAKVIAVGPGKRAGVRKNPETGELETIRVPVDVQPGEFICYMRWQGERYIVGDKYYIMMREDDVLSSFENTTEVDENEWFKPAMVGREDALISSIDESRNIG